MAPRPVPAQDWRDDRGFVSYTSIRALTLPVGISMQHHCLSIAIHQLRQAGGSPSIHVTIHVTVHVLHALPGSADMVGHDRKHPGTHTRSGQGRQI